jgi:hypothetical protein
MKRSDLKIGDSLLFHTEPKSVFDRIVPYGIQQLTKSEYNHVATYIGNGQFADYKDLEKMGIQYVMGALAGGYTKQTLDEAISDEDRVDVYRYHSDKDELTPDQQKKLVEYALSLEGTPYDFLDIVCLSILMEINNTTWEAMLLSEGFKWVLDTFGADLMESIQQKRKIGDITLQKAQGKGMLICSQADYLTKTKGAGVRMQILNDDAREGYYKATGDVIARYRAVQNEELLNPSIDYFITPRDIAQSPDMFFIGALK